MLWTAAAASSKHTADVHLGGANLVQQLPHAGNLLNVEPSQHHSLWEDSGSSRLGARWLRQTQSGTAANQWCTQWHAIECQQNVLTGSTSSGAPC